MVWSGGTRRRLVAAASACAADDAAADVGAGAANAFGCDVGRYGVRRDSDRPPVRRIRFCCTDFLTLGEKGGGNREEK